MVEVTVAITTCNRRELSLRAIEGILAQRTDFEFEVVASDDASSDGTPEALREFERRRPGRFRALLGETRVRQCRSFARILDVARGRYVAMHDDDDLWVEPTKLQRMVDYLGRRPDCVFAFHDSRHFDPSGVVPDNYVEPPAARDTFALADLVPGPFVPTTATVFRRAALPRLPEWYFELLAHEWGLHLLLAQRGPFGFLREVLSWSRFHPGGDWSGRTRAEQCRYFIHDLSVLSRNLPCMRVRATRRNLAREYHHLGEELLLEGDRRGARRALVSSLAWSPSIPAAPLSRRLRTLGRAIGNGR